MFIIGVLLRYRLKVGVLDGPGLVHCAAEFG
jgi:hypothetical protein